MGTLITIASLAALLAACDDRPRTGHLLHAYVQSMCSNYGGLSEADSVIVSDRLVVTMKCLDGTQMKSNHATYEFGPR